MSKGLLRNIPASKERAHASIKVADKWLEEANNNFNNGTINSSVLCSYLAMFHSARAVLFLDGFREKSHYCIAKYLEERYVKKNLLESKWVDLLDHYRELRQYSQYDVSFFATGEEAKSALMTAGEFTERMKKLLHSRIK